MSYDDDYSDFDPSDSDLLDLHDALKKEIRKASEKSEKRDAELAKAFGRVADALEKLTMEVRGLRADLNPQTLDKQKLQAPQQGGTTP